MRYELGLLQALVASGGRRRPARIEVVARALRSSVEDLEEPLARLRAMNFVDERGQPTPHGRNEAAALRVNTRDDRLGDMTPSVQRAAHYRHAAPTMRPPGLQGRRDPRRNRG